MGETTVAGRIDRIDQRAGWQRRDRRLQDRQSARSGGCRREPAACRFTQLPPREKWGYEVGALIFHNLEENVPVVTTRSEAQLLAAARVAWRRRPRELPMAIFEAKTGHPLQFLRVPELCVPRRKSGFRDDLCRAVAAKRTEFLANSRVRNAIRIFRQKT